MLFRVEHVCIEKGCFYKAFTMHNIVTDSIKKSILGISLKCPRCGSTMINSTQEVHSVFSVANRDRSVNFLMNEFANYRDGSIIINIETLLYSGFSGSLTIHVLKGIKEKYILDSVNMTAKKVKS